MIGRSIFDFYHPEDLPVLKEIYELGTILVEFIILYPCHFGFFFFS